MLAPINKIPPEILALIPDFWDTRNPRHRDQDVIALTHVCRAWREIFVSRSSLWTNFNCSGKEKTRVYFERSRSSPIDLSLDLNKDILPHNLFQLIPHATGRLKSLSVKGRSENVEAVTSHLSHPAPLLEHLSMSFDPPWWPSHYPALPPALFNGDLSSLRTLRLELVHTELPWRNMVNLTSLALSNIPLGAVSAGQLLDFLESAPYLKEVKFHHAIPITGIQGGRLVSLGCLECMDIEADVPCSALLDHLLIPAGAKLTVRAHLSNSSPIGEHLPRSLGNLRNLSDFTAIQLYPHEFYQGMKFSGPNGQVNITLSDDRTDLIFESLAELDTSKTERLEIDGGYYLLSRETLSRALLPMKDLRTLTLSRCRYPYTLIYALEPYSSEVVVCPKLEEFVLMSHPYKKIVGVIEMAEARASRGEKLRTLRIVGGLDMVNLDMSELGRYVCNVECGPMV